MRGWCAAGAQFFDFWPAPEAPQADSHRRHEDEDEDAMDEDEDAA